MQGWNGKPLGKLEKLTTQQWTDGFWIVSLSVAALGLFLVGLGSVPLRDWDEGIVAQVAREIWRSQTGASPNALAWLYPTLGNAPYLNKPTLIHWLIAQCYEIGGVNEWTSRLPGAVLTALSVPLMYGVGRELFAQKTPAVFAALTYLTFLPIVRHGRLAMLDGPLVCFALLMVYCLLRARRDLRWGLGVGIGFGLMCLTKGIVGFVLVAIAFSFMIWDTPRLLRSRYLWVGLILGGTPVAAWYWTQWLKYGSLFINTNLINQSLSRVWSSVEGNQGPVWFYVLEVLKYGLPWLVFLPQGFKSAWEHRNLGWAKLTLIWVGVYLLVISLMQTKLPWYVLPLYPALALVSGSMLANSWHIGDLFGIRYFPRRSYPLVWSAIFGLFAIAGWLSSLYFGVLSSNPSISLSIIFCAVAVTLSVVTLLLLRQDSQFILVLFWGMYISLLMFMVSPYWLWELNESFPVKPLAAMVQQNTPPNQLVLTSYPYGRPSLNFYSDRTIVAATEFYAARNISLLPGDAIARYWKETPQPYVLLDEKILQTSNLDSIQTLGNSQGFTLITRKSDS